MKEDTATAVAFTLGGTGAVATNDIKLQMTAPAAGVTSGTYSNAVVLLSVGNDQDTVMTGKDDSITIANDGTANTADITITYTLTTGA